MGNKKRKKGEKSVADRAAVAAKMIVGTLPTLSGNRRMVRITIPELTEGKGPPSGFIFVAGASAQEVAEACLGRGLAGWGLDDVSIDEVKVLTLEEFRERYPFRDPTWKMKSKS